MKKAEELVSVEEVRENPREICNEINCLSDQELKAFIVKILTWLGKNRWTQWKILTRK